MGEHLRCQCYRESSKGFRSPRSDWPEKGGGGGGFNGVNRQPSNGFKFKRQASKYVIFYRQPPKT